MLRPVGYQRHASLQPRPETRLVTGVAASAGALLTACERSSGGAYEAFRELLDRLETPEERPAARRLLEEAVRELEASGQPPQQAARFHASVERLPAGGEGEAGGGELALLQLPGVFAPEDWSRTFFEGLARYPAGDLEGLAIAELGCGSGWITLALARRCLARRVYGLDVNPRAIVCARLNLYLNGLDAEGRPIPDADGRSLLDRVELAVSDLLAHPRDQGVQLDRVVGCIPQVLRPDLSTTVEAVAETASDEFLYSLSNYTGKQGYVEDQFGLGLIARAIEESVDLLRPNGRMIFNLGGRPGRGVLRRMFERRGVEVREVWTTTIAQAGDTDILPLVEIEANTPHRFEFYLGRHADEPVSAATAWAFSRAGGEISHSLLVFEGRLRFPAPTRRIVRHVAAEGFRDARSALDLAYDDDSRAEEKTAFLAHLAEGLTRIREEDLPFLYGPTAGSASFRRHLAEYLMRYFGVPLGPESLVVLPGRRAAIRNLLDLYRPRLALVDRELARELPRGPLPGTSDSGSGAGGAGHAATGPETTTVLEGARRADLTCRLVEALGPGLVVTSLAEFEARTPDAFARLVETTARTGCRLVVDISDQLELSSTPELGGVFRTLAEGPLPPHVAILCGLVRNRVYQDLEVAFLIAENRGLLQALVDAAELTYSRTPALAQDYYDVIVEELLAFRVPRSGEPTPLRKPRDEEEEAPGDDAATAGATPAASLPSLAERCRRAFRHPAVATGKLPIGPSTVRLDYGENALPAPDAVGESLMEAFARQALAPAELDPAPQVRALLERRLGIPTGEAGHLVTGLGVADLFAALLRGAEGPPTVLFPTGAYGYFPAAVELLGGTPLQVPTRREDAFKLTPEAVAEALDRIEGGGSTLWLYLNAPVTNPSGAIYSRREIQAILETCREAGARIILDTVFAGLEHEAPPDGATRGSVDAVAGDVVVLGGISKELAAAGLRFGYAWTASAPLADVLSRGHPTEPHGTVRFAARRMLERILGRGPATAGQLAAQRRTLAERAGRLGRVLKECGWEPLEPEGGLFLVARPVRYLGRSATVETASGRRELVLDGETVAEALFWNEELLINDSVWTGIPGWCRFAFAVPERELEEGLARLRRFAARVGVAG